LSATLIYKGTSSLMRLLILGNSGAGKTTLAADMGRLTGVSVISLDSIFWEPGGFNAKRGDGEMERDLAAIRDGQEWIVEGVFGDLAGKLVDSATHLVFLDLSWDDCRTGLLSRGSESARHRNSREAARRFDELLRWAEAYYDRQGARSRSGHSGMFDEFPGIKLRLTHHEAAAPVLSKLTRG
jgi:adenylate kinase family enzyme